MTEPVGRSPSPAPTLSPTLRYSYEPGPSLEDLGGDAVLRRGHSGESVRELQRLLNASGVQPPLAVDGLFGPKTEAAVREITARSGTATADVDAAALSAIRLEAAREQPSPRPAPNAPKYGEPPPEGTISAGTLQRDLEQQRRLRTGPPPGYHTMTGRIPPGVVEKAKTLLHHDYGTEIPFELDGKRYLARLERHYHPPGYVGGPNGWHKGVTVYEAN